VLPLVVVVIPLTPLSVETSGDDNTILLFETPTLNAPRASNDKEPAPATPDDTLVVVFPTANKLCAPAATVAPAMMIVFEEYPTEIAPLPENDRASGNTDDVEEDAPVVLPTANRLRFCDGPDI
jgi:hypothetical protein